MDDKNLVKDLIEELVSKNHELEQELEIRINDNADLYANLCNTLMRLREADEILYDFICNPYPNPITYEMREKLEKYRKKYDFF